MMLTRCPLNFETKATVRTAIDPTLLGLDDMTPTEEQMNVNLPYFDRLLEHFERGNRDAIAAFGRHVHWGYWENPDLADGSVADFARAAEELSRQVCDAGNVGNDLRILDCGCGFGGTIASLNERFSRLDLVGLNIDDRQLARAKSQVQPQNQNAIAFVQGNACDLPFEDSTFDVVLAVECIFHFPSRDRFFQEARRVLKTGGRLAICDFIPWEFLLPLIQFANLFVHREVESIFGNVDSNFTLSDYQKLAQKTGFKPRIEADITRHTLPTYPALRQMQRRYGADDAAKINDLTEWVSRLGIIRYFILAFEAVE